MSGNSPGERTPTQALQELAAASLAIANPLVFVFGRYRWFPKRIAYRSDYCLNCDAPRIAQQIRTFDVGHLYWILVLPLGVWCHWHCLKCGANPHARTHTGRGMKVLGAIGFLIPAVAVWLIPVKPNDLTAIWSARAVFTALFLVFVALVKYHKPQTTLAERLQGIPELDDKTCLFCGGELWGMPRQCLQCGVFKL